MSVDSCNWNDLEHELACWREQALCPTLWWRDDDATVADGALQRLCALSVRHAVPLSLAAIPARASADLAPLLADCARVTVLQHGFAHTDYGNGAEPSAELGNHRALQLVLDELLDGRERLRAVVGEYLLPVLVPPWNRIDRDLSAQLAGAGYRGLSCFAARDCTSDSRGLVLSNCHVDPVHWRRGGVFRGESKSLSMLIGHLRSRRLGQVDAGEATGILSHHWRHDAATWGFLERLFEQTGQRDDVCWLDAPRVFGL